MGVEQIVQMVLLALGAAGFTQISKKAVSLMGTITLPPIAKQAITVVAGLVLAAASGVPITDVFPGGAAVDGAIVGLIVTAAYGLFFKKKTAPTP